MRILERWLSGAALALILACPARAEITPEDLWAGWKAASGGPVTVATEAREGDALVISEAVFLTGPAGSESRVTFPKIVLREAPGGLAVSLPEGILLNLANADGSAGPGSVVAVATEGLTVSVTGDRVEDAAYALTAPEIRATLISTNGVSAQDAGGAASATLRDTAGTFGLPDGIVTADMQSRSLEIALSGDRTGAGSGTGLVSKTSDLHFAGRFRVPADIEGQFSEMIAAGFLFDFISEFDRTELTFDYADGADSGTVTAAMAETGLRVSINEQGLVFAEQVADLDLAVTAAFAPPGPDGGTGSLTASLTGFSFSTDTFMPALMLERELGVEVALAEAMKAGFSTSNTLTLGKLDAAVDIKDTPETGTVRLALTGGGGNLAMDAKGLDLGFFQTGLTLSAEGLDMPVPVLDVALKEAAFAMVTPVLPGNAPEPFRLLSKIDTLTLYDSLWALFDPAGKLPRGPLTQILDVSGMATLFVPIDEIEKAEAAGKIPGELNAIRLVALNLSGLGAQITGSGSLTIDNSGEDSFHGMPRPQGTLTFDARGLTGLLSTLGDAGLMTPEMLTGARVGMAMILKPGPGEDHLTSAIEFRDEGLFVNGLRME